MDLTQLGEVIINFNSQTNQQELGRHEVHDYQGKRLEKMLKNFANDLVDLENNFGGGGNEELTKMRCQLFEKYQKMIAIELHSNVNCLNMKVLQEMLFQ